MTEPIQKSVHVDCPIEDAFQLFTERIAEWWPGDGQGSLEIEPWAGGRVFERIRPGDEHECGSVIAWDPPVRLEFTWQSGSVDVEFQVEADGTRVSLIHTGWELDGVQASARCFAAFVSTQILMAV